MKDATAPTLTKTLDFHTDLFAATPRSIETIEEYRDTVKSCNSSNILDPAIHVCEFTGYLNPEKSIIGCMLHPNSSGNSGIDLRGLCHYGSMACKGFYCPAWTQIPQHYLQACLEFLQDYHLYGLVITDVDFVNAIFKYLELVTKQEFNICSVSENEKRIISEIFGLKNDHGLSPASNVRKSKYYVHGRQSLFEWNEEMLIEIIVDSISYTYEYTTSPELIKTRLLSILRNV